MLLGPPLALLGLLGFQAVLATRAERLPEPAYEVATRVLPDGPQAGPEVRLVMLGDSTVAGIGAPTLEGALPHLVAERVAARTGRAVQLRGYGVSGARTADIVDLQLGEIGDFAPDVVIVVVGSNDVTHLTPPWRLRAQVGELAEEVEGEIGAPLVLGGIPLFGSADLLGEPLRSVVGAYADVLRPVQRAAASAAGATFVEIARDASPRFRGVPEAMSEDGFHPAPVGYGFWADAIAPAVVDALETR